MLIMSPKADHADHADHDEHKQLLEHMRALLDTGESDVSELYHRWLARLGRPTPPIA